MLRYNFIGFYFLQILKSNCKHVQTAAEEDEDPNDECNEAEDEITEEKEVVDLTSSPRRNE